MVPAAAGPVAAAQAVRWTSIERGPNDGDEANAVARSPSAGTVYVTGSVRDKIPFRYSYGLLVSYDAAGRIYQLSGSRGDSTADVRAYDMRGRLWWTTSVASGGGSLEPLRLVLDAARGRLYFAAANEAGPSGYSSIVTAALVSLGDLAVDPATGRVVVASVSYPNEGTTPGGLILRAYEASGRIAWTRTLPANDGPAPAAPLDLVIDPGDDTVYLTGTTTGDPDPYADWITLAIGGTEG